MGEATDISDISARAVDLAGLVAYQQGAVVSRTLIKKGQGTVTLFAFDRGEGLSEHTAPYDALVCMLEGRARIKIGTQSLDAGAGQLVVMPASVPHALHAPERFKMMLVMIRA